MTAVHHPTDFNCPGCGAGYKVVRVKAEADPPMCFALADALDLWRVQGFTLFTKSSIKAGTR
jgi:hypothetical protein